jgi:hypothetical protein
MTAFSADIITAVAFAAAILINRQAFILLAAHLLLWVAFLSPTNDFWFNLSAAIIYAAAATVFIHIKSELRYAMMCIAGLYYLGAVDAFLFPYTETLYYNSISYLIGAVDLYALLIVCYGGRFGARIDRPFASLVFRLQSH